MATEKLIVELDAKTTKLDAALKKTNAKLVGLEAKSKKADSGLLSMSRAAGTAGKGLKSTAAFAKKTAIAVAAMNAAVIATAKVAAEYAKEIKTAATLTNVSVESMQALSYATNTVGISMEKMSDISKDTSEKIGEFLNTGGGGFQDFADAMGMSEEQAAATAKEFQGMAGPDVLQAMVSQMESAGVNSEQMSHALEGMASDTTNLIPLLKDGGKAIKELKQHFYETNVVLSETDITKLGELSSSFSDLSSTFKATLGKFSVEYADQINSMIDSTQEGLKLIGDEFASGSFTDRINSFYDAFTSSWAAAFGDNLGIVDDFSGDVTEVIGNIAAAYLDFSLSLPINFAIAGNKVKEIFADIWDEIQIKSAEAYLTLQQGLDLVGAGDLSGAQASLDAIYAETEARDEASEKEIERLETEKQAILEKFNAEQEAATVKREQYAADSAERMSIDDEEAEASKDRVDGVKKNEDKNTTATVKINKVADEAKKKSNKDYANDALAMSDVIFGDNKITASASALMNTYEGVTKALSKQDYAGASLTLATGLAQVASINSTEKGSSGSSSSSGSISAPEEIQTTDLTVSATDVSGEGSSQTLTINIESDDSELAVALSGILGNAKTSGVIS